MRIIYCFYLTQLLLATSCYSQKPVTYTDAVDQNLEKAITLSGFPSRDTASITFYKKDGWFVSVRMRNPVIVKKPESCKDCDEVFTDAFFDYLSSIQTETVLSNDCTVAIDSIIDGKQVTAIRGFYLQSDLQEERISIKKGKKTFAISYLEPRNALKFCKTNTNRIAFIGISDRLLKVR